MKSGKQLLLSLAPATSIARWARQEPAVRVFSLTLAAICIDYVLIPPLNTVAPAASCGMLLFLLFRYRSSGSFPPQEDAPVGPSRTLLFLTLHLATVSVIWAASGLREAMDSVPNLGIAAAKYLVLAPTIVLLPMAGWRRFDRLYRAEWVAAAIALFTFFPYRIFAAAWPWYSQVLGRVVDALAHPLVAGLQYVALPVPLLVGPKLDVSILFWCSGLESIKLFQVFFVLMLVIDWVAINRRRALVGYFGGLALMLVANVTRITLLVILGNMVPQFTVHHHITAGWIFFASVLVVYVLATHKWLMEHRGGGQTNNPVTLMQDSLPSRPH